MDYSSKGSKMPSQSSRYPNLRIVPSLDCKLTNHVDAIYPTPVSFNTCPFCGEETKQYVYAIRITNNQCALIYGYICFPCRKLFSTNQKGLALFQNNTIKVSPPLSISNDYNININQSDYAFSLNTWIPLLNNIFYLLTIGLKS